jgi:hypothetical protein
MTDQPYTNREIDYHFETINDKLDAILIQTTRTNGRVTKTEKDIERIKASSKIANWAFGITVPLIISMAVWIFFNQIQEIRHDLEAHQTGDLQKWDLVFKKLDL